MAKFYTELTPTVIGFIERQQMFFVASAPQSGRINLSPKGMPTFRVLGPTRVGYLDFTGSGNETAAHIAENGRVTIMFCSFEENPLILRLYGRGQVVRKRDAAWDQTRAPFGDERAGERQVILLEIESVQTSCGFSIPRYDFIAHRSQLLSWSEKQGEDGIRAYWEAKNQTAIDGLPTFLLKD